MFVKRHGMCSSREYSTWQGIKRRCYNKKEKSYKHYGGRGIIVCDRWLNSFESFLSDMGEKPSGFSIERLDNNGNYEPCNCVWASRKSQCNNRRSSHLIEVNGESRTIAEWSLVCGVDAPTISRRIRTGWSPTDAVTTAVDVSRRNSLCKKDLH